MNVVIIGAGPMPCEPQFAVMAPGARTWQIAQTVANALADGGEPPQIVVYGLEQVPRKDGAAPRAVEVPLAADPQRTLAIRYAPLTYEAFIALARGHAPADTPLPAKVDAVIGTASVQPLATAAALAAARTAPLWVDVFGDPFAEIQSKAQLYPHEQEANDKRYHHVWKLLLSALLQGDAFSALSARQRFALIGQLGCAGRLNRHLAGMDFVHAIPFGLFPADAPEPPARPRKQNFIAMWCGSFNTWMDAGALVAGVVGAVARNPRFRLLVVGGKIANYNEDVYGQFVEGIREAGVEHAVQLADWVPLEEIRKLYPLCDVGLSIDRHTYEAALGSRTRIVQFLAAGVPVISTVATELAQELREKGFVLPFAMDDPPDLARALLDAAERPEEMRELGAMGRRFVMERFGGVPVGRPLEAWIRNPAPAPDKLGGTAVDPRNPLVEFWKRAAFA